MMRFAAVCAAISAVTTFLLWLLPQTYDAPRSFQESIALHANVRYMARLWVNFAHQLVAIVAYGGAAWVLARRAPALARAGFIAFLIWAFLEILGVTVNIFAVNRTWRAEYATATPQEQLVLRANLVGFQAVWDAMFFLLLIAFLIGSLCYGVALLRDGSRALGVLFLLAVPLTIGITLSGYAGVTLFDDVLNWTYPVLQPVSRGWLAAWLWKRARPSGAPAASPAS